MHTSTELLELVHALAVYAEQPRIAVVPICDPAAAADAQEYLLRQDRRAYPRRRPLEFDHPLVARLKSGPILRLVDVSVGGALIETQARLAPGAQILVEFIAPATRETTLVRSRVIRSHVAGLADGIRYRGACSFDGPLTIEPIVAPRADRRSAFVAALAAFRAPRATPLDPVDAAIARLVADLSRMARASASSAALSAHVDGWLRQRVPLLALRVRRAARGGRLQIEVQPACVLEPPQKRLLDAGGAILRLLFNAA